MNNSDMTYEIVCHDSQITIFIYDWIDSEELIIIFDKIDDKFIYDSTESGVLLHSKLVEFLINNNIVNILSLKKSDTEDFFTIPSLSSKCSDDFYNVIMVLSKQLFLELI